MNQALYDSKLPGINSSEAPRNAAYDSKTNVEWHILTKTKEMVLLSMHIMARGSVSEDNGWLVCLLNKQIPFLPFKQVSFNFI